MLNGLVLAIALSTAFIPEQEIDFAGRGAAFQNLSYENVFRQDLSGSLSLGRFSVFGSLITYETPAEQAPFFYPFRADYTAGLEVRLTDWLAAGIQHECDHPVIWAGRSQALGVKAAWTAFYVKGAIRVQFGKGAQK